MSIKRELVYIDDTDQTDNIAHYAYIGNQYLVVFKNRSKEYYYRKNRVRIEKTALSGKKAFSVFNYLKEIAETIGLKTEDGYNILSESYHRITLIPENSILSSFLNGTLPGSNITTNEGIFPFGFNLSQSNALMKALSNSLSVIEGPPGTGKTQTILNIIANAVMNGQSVAVVSSNNSATKNVYEKLEKNDIGFIAALLGNAKNKTEFIGDQKEIPDLSDFKLTDEEKVSLKTKAIALSTQLSGYLVKKNNLAELRMEAENLKTEFQHFQESYKEPQNKVIEFRESIKPSAILAFWIAIEYFASKGKKPGFFRRLFFRIKYGIKSRSFFQIPIDDMILICKLKYYPARIAELNDKIESLEFLLKRFAFDHKMEEYTKMSMQLFKAALFQKYDHRKRDVYTIEDLRKKPNDFIRDYPVIMSTTYSLRKSLSDSIIYDYVIIDESSQVDLATGALALSCAKRAVIVGDSKQLPNVVDASMKERTDMVFNAYSLPYAYRYSDHSLLTSLMELFQDIPQTLLREHYRCHPKIIDFCNQKFYAGQLIILTEYKSHRQPLVVYKTVPGNHARERMNQRQIDIIKEEIIPKEKLAEVKLGIVTPYRNQTSALQLAFNELSITADTVDKFQGRENEVIILSTVDNDITEFTDNPNRLNVAVSRAQEQLIVVINGNESAKDSNIADLIKYIEYNNFAIIQSELHSIFDLLYKGYEEARARRIGKSGSVSRYDSENLMYGLVKQVLSEEIFLKYDVLLHFPLKDLIKDFTKLNEQERKYANNPLTHLDFLIYSRLGKSPVLAIEVDGYEFHRKETRQSERDKMKDEILEKYNFPLLRFKTNESNEKEKLRSKLLEIQQGK